METSNLHQMNIPPNTAGDLTRVLSFTADWTKGLPLRASAEITGVEVLGSVHPREYDETEAALLCFTFRAALHCGITLHLVLLPSGKLLTCPWLSSVSPALDNSQLIWNLIWLRISSWPSVTSHSAKFFLQHLDRTETFPCCLFSSLTCQLMCF